MPIGFPFRFPDEQWEARRRAKRIAWLSIALLLGASMFLAFALGQSQAMKTAWMSDVLTAIPPLTFIMQRGAGLGGSERGLTRVSNVADSFSSPHVN